MPSVNSNNTSHDADNELEEVMMEEEVRGTRKEGSFLPRELRYRPNYRVMLGRQEGGEGGDKHHQQEGAVQDCGSVQGVLG